MSSDDKPRDVSPPRDGPQRMPERNDRATYDHGIKENSKTPMPSKAPPAKRK